MKMIISAVGTRTADSSSSNVTYRYHLSNTEGSSTD